MFDFAKHITKQTYYFKLLNSLFIGPTLSFSLQAFDPDCEFHFKNRNKRWDRSYYEDLFGFQKCPAISPSFCIGKVSGFYDVVTSDKIVFILLGIDLVAGKRSLRMNFKIRMATKNGDISSSLRLIRHFQI